MKDDEEEGERVRTRVCGQVTSVSGGRVEVSVLVCNGEGHLYRGGGGLCRKGSTRWPPAAKFPHPPTNLRRAVWSPNPKGWGLGNRLNNLLRGMGMGGNRAIRYLKTKVIDIEYRVSSIIVLIDNASV
jgi:hypothetical protein